MKSRLISAAAFLLSLAAGKCLVSWSMAAKNPPPAPHAPVTAAGIAQRLHDRSAAPGSAGTPADTSTLRGYIAWERKMWNLEPDRLGDEFAAEVPNAVSGERLHRLLAIWEERDFDGFVKWARKQRDTVFLPSAGFYFGISDALIAAATRKDPEFAWKLASGAAVNPAFTNQHRGGVIGTLLREDPEAARAFIRRHRDEIAASEQGNMGWHWHGLNPQKVTSVAMELPSASLRNAAFREMARYYGERAGSTAAAGEWFRSLPVEHQREVSKLPAGGSLYRISKTHQRRLMEVWAVSDDE